MTEIDAIIIGGGPAGLAAAAELYKKGIHDILILEREPSLGGILRQCIHDGFGLTRFKETLSGPEYAQRFIDKINAYHIPYLTDTMVLSIKAGKKKIVTAASRNGLKEWSAKAVILAMGCRERTRGALGIPGERPAGVFTAGTAQAYMNLYNRMPGKEIVILGSGDIGMIMARRLTLEGAHVQAVFEILPYASGLPRNVQQCLLDYGIPLSLSHTVTEIHGNTRLKGVTVSKVDDARMPIPGTERFYACDTLILSVGLIPENELTADAGATLDTNTGGAIVDENFQTSLPGVFAAGNVLHVHDLVDFVSMEAEKLADSAATYILEERLQDCPLKIKADNRLGHVLPQRISGKTDFILSLRVRHPYRNGHIIVRQGGRTVGSHGFRRAVPAEMLQFKIKATDLVCTEDLEVNVE